MSETISFGETDGMDDGPVLSMMLAKDEEEVAIGRLAQQRGSTEFVRAFGSLLVADYASHAARVRTVANAARINPTPPPDGAASESCTQLGRLTGEQFDRALGQILSGSHREVIETLKRARPGLRFTAVRDLVDQTLPVLMHHEAMARQFMTERD